MSEMKQADLSSGSHDKRGWSTVPGHGRPPADIPVSSRPEFLPHRQGFSEARVGRGISPLVALVGTDLVFLMTEEWVRFGNFSGPTIGCEHFELAGHASVS